MSRNPNLREKYLNGEALFRKYWEMGDTRSVALLAEWAILQGMKSSKGTEPTIMGVWKAMWRWASLKENRETAWEIVSQHSQMTRSQWINDMLITKIPTAWQHPTNAKRDRFLRENGWADDAAQS